MKKLLILLLCAFTFLHSQPNRKFNRGEGFGNRFALKPTVLVVPESGTSISVSYLYRIPYDLLVFEKKANNFIASGRILVEVKKDNELVRREIQDKKISVNDFNLTQSKSMAIEGIIKFDLEADTYLIEGELSDMQSEEVIKLRPVNIRGMDYIETGIYDPIVIKLENSNCNGTSLPLIVNQGGSIPFNSQAYQLIIPIADTTAETVTIKMKNNEKDLIIKTISESYVTGISALECESKLFLNTEDSSTQKTKNFILRDFSQNLDEGLLLLTINKGKEEKSQDYPIRVLWINKPISLRNPEFAIEMLQYIEEDSIISKLLDVDNERYPIVLHNYWKKYDPTPNTEFNELMEEFYSRIDYAALEFRGIGTKDGLSTDRGKVYIRFGKPDEVERYSNELGYVVETWTYATPHQKFVFVDQQGTGNFILIEG